MKKTVFSKKSNPKHKVDARKDLKSWQIFAEKELLGAAQKKRFEQYYNLLVRENENINLTALTDVLSVTRYHFADSLALRRYCDIAAAKGVVDVGTGAGFPGIPLKIVFPDVPMLLIEPSGKRRKFLELVIRELGLENIEICPYDWRTFIRTTSGDLGLFITRATLPVPELCRMFKPSSAYNGAQLVYWASEQWEPEQEVADLIVRDEAYKIGNRMRRLVFMQKGEGGR